MPGQIVVTGASGFFGRHTMHVLRERYGPERVTGVASRDFDLTDAQAVRRMFQERKPDILVHLAGYVGGIGANRAHPADFFYRNTLLMSLAFHAAAEFRIRKLVYTMGGCSYPATAVSPIGEDQMWQGYPQPDSAAYSGAKKMGIIASEAYRQQYGLNSVVMIPGNMYGEYDNFRTNESHVVPALIRRFAETKHRGENQIVCWGTGKAVRDFVYAGDVARTLPFFIEEYDSSQPVNISSGTTTSIRELAETVHRFTEFPGEIVWDASKPEGQLIKIFDVTRMKSLGLACDTALEEGLRRTIGWFLRNYENAGDGLRL
jgi:GDP-L-fucose synthase